MPQDGSVGPLSYPQEVQDTLASTTTHMNNAARAMRHLTRDILQQTSLLTGLYKLDACFLYVLFMTFWGYICTRKYNKKMPATRHSLTLK